MLLTWSAECSQQRHCSHMKESELSFLIDTSGLENALSLMNNSSLIELIYAHHGRYTGLERADCR
jgi:hypothetical protein